MQEHWSSCSQLSHQAKKLEGPVEFAAGIPSDTNVSLAAIDSNSTEGPQPNPPHADPPVQADGPGPPNTITVLQLGSAHTKKRTLIKLEGKLAGRPAIGSAR